MQIEARRLIQQHDDSDDKITRWMLLTVITSTKERSFSHFTTPWLPNASHALFISNVTAPSEDRETYIAISGHRVTYIPLARPNDTAEANES